MTKTQEIIEMIKEDKTNSEIMAEVACSKGLISQVRSKLRSDEDASDDPMTAEEQTDLDDSFIRKIKIEPDPELLTDNKEKKKKAKSYSMQCGSCGYKFTVESEEHIDECENCGCVFE